MRLWKNYQSTGKGRAEVLQDLVLRVTSGQRVVFLRDCEWHPSRWRIHDRASDGQQWDLLTSEHYQRLRIKGSALSYQHESVPFP